MTKLIISSSLFQSQISDLLPCNNFKKSQLTYSLLNAMSLLECFDHVITNPYCSQEEMMKFHSKEYINTIMNPRYNNIMPYDEGNESKWNELNEMAKQWYDLNNIEAPEGRSHSRLALYERFKELSVETNRPSHEVSIPTSKKRSAWEALLDESNSTTEEPVNKRAEKENSNDNEKEMIREKLKGYNLEGDCPIFSYLPVYCQVIVGATLSLAKHITAVANERTIAVNWDGGRHHALRNKASGFCYINDIVLLIQQLRSNGYKRITYIDFDLHHGDGVQRSFQYSTSVQTISAHMFEPGFFPCTGSLKESKMGKNIVNIPLLHGVDDMLMNEIVEKVMIPCVKRYDPEILVIQCGGDGLIGDGYAEWQLTIHGLVNNILKLLRIFPGCPVVLLGGGGYNETVMSRFYTYLTWKIVDEYSNKKSLKKPFQAKEERIHDKDRSIKGYQLDDRHTDDILITDHELIEAYREEHYKFWIYEQEGSSKRKNLRNDNGETSEVIKKLRNFYSLDD
ncbi:histone deacetylase NDAI_0A05120 [Naumovozyma dairenensis CBS 421]|uniref:histone deacetylase n=1 Tax=Naumovozyma dairenensis (strain ATCC 10597 / BCRC 20456 / CBS 421 / NBRC 0211 / NRRL Y-12639) TaxID=1071378 RepID=G0W4C9_NAUDC|nr:hypothetical protein NDAI_0A05120 [Naumovozyma dairenensis CBS 421]CCD22667.1 hypothetical protein NDAI_0A05120 [Naumovozyma dairenensis CBS 421]